MADSQVSAVPDAVLESERCRMFARKATSLVEKALLDTRSHDAASYAYAAQAMWETSERAERWEEAHPVEAAGRSGSEAFTQRAAADRQLLEDLAGEFSGAGTETANRIANRIREHLEAEL